MVLSCQVWDVRNYRCVQSFPAGRGGVGSATGEIGFDSVSALLFEPVNRRLLACSTSLQSWKTKGAGVDTSSRAHRVAVVAALYNPLFNQVWCKLTLIRALTPVQAQGFTPTSASVFLTSRPTFSACRGYHLVYSRSRALLAHRPMR
jgi:hypothetical protein